MKLKKSGYKIIDERQKSMYRQGIVATIDLLNSLNLFDHLLEEEMEKIEWKIVKLMEIE